MKVSASIEREQARMALPIRNGVFIAVVGPSGAGKDTIIAHARERFAGDGDVVFVRRTVTRPCNGSSEDHDTLDEPAFEREEAAGAFALSWQAHGLSYGVPASIDHEIDNGRIVVANISRGRIEALRERYENVAVALITATPEVLARRLAARGRETDHEILARLARASAIEIAGPGVVSIDNSGERSDAGERFVALIRKAIAFADVGRF